MATTRDDFWLLLHDMGALLKSEFSGKLQTRQLQLAFDRFPESVKGELCEDLKNVMGALEKFSEHVQTSCDDVKRQPASA